MLIGILAISAFLTVIAVMKSYRHSRRYKNKAMTLEDDLRSKVSKEKRRQKAIEHFENLDE
jgi:predicted histidine transporter YuiF (NhaC family)